MAPARVQDRGVRYISDDEREDARMEEIDDKIRWAVCVNGHRFDPGYLGATRYEPACPRIDECPNCGTGEWEYE